MTRRVRTLVLAMAAAAVACTSPVARPSDAGAHLDAAAPPDVELDAEYDSGLSDVADAPEPSDMVVDIEDAHDAAGAADAKDTGPVYKPAACLPASALASSVPLPANSTPVCLFDNTLTCTETALPAPVDVTDTTCSPACPAPYPCYCGACPWLPTAPMLQPYKGHHAVWTGKEILVFGDMHWSNSDYHQLTGERWDPYGTKGWQPIAVPPNAQAINADPTVTGVFWTGKQALVVADTSATWPSFSYDPMTGAWKAIATSGHRVLAGGKLMACGYDCWPKCGDGCQLYNPDMDTSEDVSPPKELLPQGQTAVYGLTVSSGDDVFVYDVQRLAASGPWPAGMGESKVTLQFHVPTKTWSVVPGVPPTIAHWSASVAVGSPEGFLIWGEATTSTQTTPTGAAYRKANQTWTPMSTNGVPYPLVNVTYARGTWAGGRYALVGGRLADTVTPYPASFAKASWPLLYDPSLGTWVYPPPWGGPNDVRFRIAIVATDKELFALGGEDGPDESVYLIHNDGVRLPLPPPPPGG